MDQPGDLVRENLGQRRDIGRIGLDPGLEIVRQIAAQFIRVARQREENRM